MWGCFFLNFFFTPSAPSAAQSLCCIWCSWFTCVTWPVVSMLWETGVSPHTHSLYFSLSLSVLPPLVKRWGQTSTDGSERKSRPTLLSSSTVSNLPAFLGIPDSSQISYKSLHLLTYESSCLEWLKQLMAFIFSKFKTVVTFNKENPSSFLLKKQNKTQTNKKRRLTQTVVSLSLSFSPITFIFLQGLVWREVWVAAAKPTLAPDPTSRAWPCGRFPVRPVDCRTTWSYTFPHAGRPCYLAHWHAR